MLPKNVGLNGMDGQAIVQLVPSPPRFTQVIPKIVADLILEIVRMLVLSELT